MQPTIKLITNGKGLFAVFISRLDDLDICILPYDFRVFADVIVNAYVSIGYKYKGVYVE